MNSYFTLAAVALSMFIGWHSHSWYDGYKGEKAAVVEAHRAAATEVKVIHDTQVITKTVTKYVKTSPCLNEPVPADLLKQLH